MESANDPSSSIGQLIPPRKYLVRKVGLLDFTSSIYELEDGDSPESIGRAASNSGTKFKIFNRGRDAEEYQPLSSGETAKPILFVQSMKNRSCRLFRGSEVAQENLLIVVDGEGVFNKSSTYTEVGGLKRVTRMYKTDGPDPSGFWTFDRTLIGFDGTVYRWKNSWGDNETLIRLSDGIVIAFFKKKQLSTTKVGTLKIKEPVAEDFFHLIQATLWVKWAEDLRRK